MSLDCPKTPNVQPVAWPSCHSVQVQLTPQPLRIGKAPTIRNRTVPTLPSVCAEAQSQVIAETHLRRRRRRSLAANSKPSQHNQTAAADESGFRSSAIESREDRSLRTPFPRNPSQVTDSHRSLSLLLTYPGFPQHSFRADCRGCSPSRCCSVFKSVVSTLVSETSTPYPSWASISPLEFSQPSAVLLCVLAVVQGETP